MNFATSWCIAKYKAIQNKIINLKCDFQPISNGLGNWPWCPREENGLADRRYRYTLTSLSNRKCIGFARRRLGRGGRVILDRASTNFDDLWRQLDFTVIEPQPSNTPKSIMEQYMSRKEEEEKSSVSMDKLNEVKNILNDFTSVKTHWARNNSDSVSNGLLSGANTSESVSENISNKCDFKSDSYERTEFNKDRFEQDELLEMFREIKRDWYVFSPLFLIPISIISLFFFVAIFMKKNSLKKSSNGIVKIALIKYVLPSSRP